MKVGELIQELNKFSLEQEVMILDGYNGGGVPREVNLGPQIQTVEDADAEETADCEGLVGEDVVVLGFGCY